VLLKIAKESAKIEAVKIGSRVKIILAIVVKNITNRYQASGFKPSGVGIIQSTRAIKKSDIERVFFDLRSVM
jgi:hypothetical protein